MTEWRTTQLALDLISDREKYEMLMKAVDFFLDRDSDAAFDHLRDTRRVLDEEESRSGFADEAAEHREGNW